MGSSLINWLRSSFHGNKLKQVGRSKSIDSGSPRLLAWDENTNVDRIDKVTPLIRIKQGLRRRGALAPTFLQTMTLKGSTSLCAVGHILASNLGPPLVGGPVY